ncbi:uncharacterized protein KY384_007748 [Bacidia gigantensis]|uniref:uncharacterized protein n=1 Tax=Bacidia gigantensis TaxID=2732470 RepID=UPI001D04A89D|nr:uncharacterized protein KY384_007748 [Bacidia gigantensis]KAG8527595.1 hypothetical protein KY384_007748 [Bacidia gigantensis]
MTLVPSIAELPTELALEIRHHWAIAPKENVSLFPHERSRGPNGHDYYLPQHYRPTQHSFTALDGLEKLQSIKLECVPELDESVMAQLLGSSKIGSNLSSLELRFCMLADEAITQLLYHAPPNLKHLVILTKARHHSQHHDEEGSTRVQKETPHLCPLFRKLGKGLAYLEYGANRICRELFFDDLEIESIAKDGILTNLGMRGVGQ